MMDFTDTSMHLIELQQVLGLGDWDIRLGDWLDEDYEVANVRYRMDERCATLRVNPRTPEEHVRRTVAHELVHVLLRDYTALAMDRRSEEVMDRLTNLEELVCNRIATAITGQGWVPIEAADRKYHEPFVPPTINPDLNRLSYAEGEVMAWTRYDAAVLRDAYDAA